MIHVRMPQCGLALGVPHLQCTNKTAKVSPFSRSSTLTDAHMCLQMALATKCMCIGVAIKASNAKIGLVQTTRVSRPIMELRLPAAV